MMKKGSLTLFFILISLFFAFSAKAQVQEGDIVLEINPNYPRANETVKATLTTYATDLNRARISWILDGQTSIEKVGQKSFSFRLGDSGTKTTLEAQIITANGSIVDKKMIISPMDIDLLWQAYNSYVPPFYKGKALPVREGIIKVTAQPSSSDAGGLSYKWIQDDIVESDSSGYGKNSYLVINDFLDKNNNIDVTATDLLGNIIGEGNLTTNLENPRIVFYEKDPLLGIKWEKALKDGFSINKNGETLVAEPYFFSPANLNSSNLDFKWTIGNNAIDTPSPKNEIGIKPQTGQNGTSKITLTINNIKSLFLNLTKEFNVNF